MGKPLTILNLEHTVGASGVNATDDVRIVKALFYFVPRDYKKTNSQSNAVGVAGNWNYPTSKIPSAFDSTMWGVVEITKSFQKFANKMFANYGYKVNVSGTIKPSKGYALSGKTFSTIAALNIFAALGARGYRLDYIDQIISESRGDFEYLYEEIDEYEGHD